jgi:flagellar basal body-associated protein FliL
VIDSIVTNTVTGRPESALITAGGRRALSAAILKAVNAQTNATISHVYFPNLAVQ